MIDDKMVRFSIAPTGGGAWLWQTLETDGRVRARGIAPSRKLAAALVVRDIVAARLERSARLAAAPAFKAA